MNDRIKNTIESFSRGIYVVMLFLIVYVLMSDILISTDPILSVLIFMFWAFLMIGVHAVFKAIKGD